MRMRALCPSLGSGSGVRCLPSACGRGGAPFIGDVLAPADRAAGLVVLLHGDVGHETVRSGAVPVILAWLEEHAVAGTDDLDRAALALTQADALGDEDRLAGRVR